MLLVLGWSDFMGKYGVIYVEMEWFCECDFVKWFKLENVLDLYWNWSVVLNYICVNWDIICNFVSFDCWLVIVFLSSYNLLSVWNCWWFCCNF